MRRLLAVACGLLAIAGLWMCIHALQMPATPAIASPQPVVVPSSSIPDDTLSAPTSRSATTKPKLKVHASAAYATPSWLIISSVKISESISPMGLARPGEIEPPPGQTIWYTGSPKPGRPGISVVEGHVEYGAPEAFWRLDEVSVGAVITIGYSDGTSVRFVVTHKRSEPKDAVQHDPEVWGKTTKSSKLVLITCDKYSPVVDHHFLNNFLVFASPV